MGLNKGLIKRGAIMGLFINAEAREKTMLERYALHLAVACTAPSLVDYLREEGFYTAPASTRHHGAYEGGLFDHCFKTAEWLTRLTSDNGLHWQKQRSPFIVGMFHDLCKIDAYIVDTDGIRWNDNQLFDAHGEKSIYILQRHFNLTDEEIMCIRWHMGAFDDKENWNRYTRACKAFPNVLWTHHADMLASQVDGI